jgi:hypothetical protein
VSSLFKPDLDVVFDVAGAVPVKFLPATDQDPTLPTLINVPPAPAADPDYRLLRER